MMKTIASFTVNHDLLERGIYLSRIDGDAVTYDIRMKKPNAGSYLSNGALHTIEHLLATYVRNSEQSDKVIYAGPMGCRTGFYLVVRDTLSPAGAVTLIQQAFDAIRQFDGEIPGHQQQECGNYQEHDLVGARQEATDFLAVIRDWTEDDIHYQA